MDKLPDLPWSCIACLKYLVVKPDPLRPKTREVLECPQCGHIGAGRALPKPDKSITLDTNCLGERSTRKVIPSGRLYFGSNVWHPEPQWLFEAVDVDNGLAGVFALAGVHSVAEKPVPAPAVTNTAPCPWDTRSGICTRWACLCTDSERAAAKAYFKRAEKDEQL